MSIRTTQLLFFIISSTMTLVLGPLLLDIKFCQKQKKEYIKIKTTTVTTPKTATAANINRSLAKNYMN